MKISKKMLMLLLITTSLVIPTTLVVSCSTNPKDDQTENTKWIDLIKESSAINILNCFLIDMLL